MANANEKYWEVETPKEFWGEKSVAKIYSENGKVQVFPVVKNTKHGIGRGATLDLESMDIDTLKALREEINKAIEIQMTTEVAN